MDNDNCVQFVQHVQNKMYNNYDNEKNYVKEKNNDYQTPCFETAGEEIKEHFSSL